MDSDKTNLPEVSSASGSAGTPERAPRHEKMSRLAIAAYTWAGVSAVLYLLFRLWPAFADFFNRYVSAPLRILLAKLTGWIPFSLAEILLYSLLPLFIGLCVYSVKARTDSWRATWVWLGELVAAGSVLFSISVWNFAAGYFGAPLSTKLGLEAGNPTKEELYDTTLLIAEKLNEASHEVVFGEDGFSVMPYDYDGMDAALMESYAHVGGSLDFLPVFGSHTKQVLASRAMSYTNITGVYVCCTGEANINVDFPDYTIPFTAAHELAHQRGIAREDEANFMAYLVCTGAEDPYLRFCAERNMFEYLFGALWDLDREAATELFFRLEEPIRREWDAYIDFRGRRENKAVSTVSHAVNDTYLKAQGTEGSVSYDLVVRLTVAYYRAGNALGED